MHIPTLRHRLLLLTALLLPIALGAGTPAAAAPPARPKVLVIGFDGLAADRVERLMAEDKLPNLAQLQATGGYSRLRPSNPAQSPVSWASITTGWNPGKTGIFDFLRRKDQDPAQIDIGLVRRIQVEPVSAWLRVALIGLAGVLGAIAGAGLAFGVGAFAPTWRKGRRFEGSMTLGAAAFACAAFVVLRWVPEKVPSAVNLRGGEPFWVTLDRAGHRTVTFDAPLCFPPEEMHSGCCIAGLGVPDMAGTWGSFALWSDDPAVPAETETAGHGYFVGGAAASDGAVAFDVVVHGPENPLLTPETRRTIREEADREKGMRETSFEWTPRKRRESETREGLERMRTKLSAVLPTTLHRGAGASVVLQDGTTVDLVPGQWSDLLPVEFRTSPVILLHGRVRLLLESAGGPPAKAGGAPQPFKVFVGQVQWDLAHVPPNVPLTSPVDFAEELSTLGPIETIGWPEQTNPVKDRMLSDQAFLDHTYLLMGLRERRLYARLEKGDFECLFTMFSEPDRVQHALYRHVAPKCPTHDPEAAKRFGGEIDKIYLEADRIVGEVLRRAGPDAIVFVVSDHGFAPFRRGVNLNNFLRAKGWQVASGESQSQGVAGLGSGAIYFKDVDWSKTKAYAMGLGNLYLNLAGREPDGIVPLTEAANVADAIAKDLETLTDTDGAKVIRKVYRGRDLYHGARSIDAPDLVVGFEWGYRVSWQNALGAADPDIITDNTQPWSGDHCSVDPELVPAVLFSSLPLRAGVAPSVEDVAPAVLSLFGVAPNAPDGRSFLAE